MHRAIPAPRSGLPNTSARSRRHRTIWRRPFSSEAAIKQLNDRIRALESRVSQLQAAKPSSGGFLSGLFGGGGSSRGSDPIPGAEQYGRPQASAQPQYAPQQQQQSYAPQAAARGGGFMAGALQTAAGVAGGVVLGNMLTNMFSGSHPQEIVNIIEEKPQPEADTAQDATAGDDPFRRGDDQFLADNTERRLRRRLWRR